ncbi:type II toxin-antitoxin system RelE/ParE family toxin [Jiella mangrovi]|uniref:Type II toxin-antitoxin system RelE/ParE family toxin n=1 Tax=Jiella mangrovi TaxID=2821407 RepID=A0ABS4BLK5_9HYPH|nr:type II toxin-antitoxin system RelE/ParE family toxin [Jiella mangrovi]MBP0617560.1 type II toxin-antitoxin system RelE/ParE family toxin [Jiella mangrovi]
MRVVYTAEAETDLEAIADYIASDNPKRALSFVSDLRKICIDLAATPQAYPRLLRYRDFEVRRRSHGNYLIFYRINGERIEILHIIHAARDYEAILFPDD